MATSHVVSDCAGGKTSQTPCRESPPSLAKGRLEPGCTTRYRSRSHINQSDKHATASALGICSTIHTEHGGLVSYQGVRSLSIWPNMCSVSILQ